jgi:hypothetical protein
VDSLNITADQSISDLKYKPQVNLFANAGLNAIYLPAFNRFGLSTGITFSWNILMVSAENTKAKNGYKSAYS